MTTQLRLKDDIANKVKAIAQFKERSFKCQLIVSSYYMQA